MLAVLPLSSHRKRSPENNLITCFYKIRRPVPYQVDCEQSLIFLLNHSNFTFSLATRGPVERRTTARGLPTRCNYRVQSNILIMRVNCERSVRCTRQTWNHSSQAARRRLIGFMKTNQTDRFPENSCPLTTRFAPLSRQRQTTPVRRAKIW